MKTRSTDDSAPRSAALEWVVAHGEVSRVFDEVAAQLRARRRRRLGAALGALTILAIGFALWPANRPRDGATLVLHAPAFATQTLPDGTRVDLASGAAITVEFTAGSAGPRRVALGRGRVHFAVAKDPARPFVVDAGGVEVRAVGTAFTVDLDARAVDVLVTEGRVAIAQPVATGAGSRAAAVPTLVEAGSRVIVDRVVAAPAPAEVAASAAEPAQSRAPRIVLSGMPLSKVVAIFNQHATVPLEIADASLETLELSGVLRADNTTTLRQLLREQFGVIDEERGNRIVLRK